MSDGFLSAAERERWQRFPDTIPQDDLAAYFLLSDHDEREVNRQREPFNRLGYALQLCTLRYLGFVPTDFKATPQAAVSFVAEQLGIDPSILVLYDNRRTQSDHRRYVRAYLGFRQATPIDLYALQTWLLARALEHDKPTLLLQLACEKLYRERIVRPGVTRLERFVATARERAHDETFRLLTPLLTDDRKTLLKGLLRSDVMTGRTPLSWLRQEANSHAASQLLATLKKIVFLQDAGVDQWDLSSLNPNRAKWLAQIGWKSTNQYLQRMSPERRYPILTAFLQQALLHHTDIVVELFDQCLWGCHSEAKQELRHLKNSEPRIIDVSEGARVKSTNMRHHSSSIPKSSLFIGRNCYGPKDHTRFPCTTHVV